MYNQYSARYNELKSAWLSGVEKAIAFHKARNMGDFIAQVRANEAARIQMEAVWALMVSQ